MSDLNHVVLIGRLTQDAQLKYTSGGMAVASFSVAVNRRKKNGDQWIEEANFFGVALYGKTAEGLHPYLLKGKQVAVDGHLKQDRWTIDGVTKYKVSIVAETLQLLGGNPDASSQTYQAQNEMYEAKPPYRGQQSVQAYFCDDFPEDICF